MQIHFFFHIMANARRKKNHIHSLQSSEGLAVTQVQKHKAIFNHLKQHTGTYMLRTCSLNLADLGWEPKDLSHLELPFTEEELKKLFRMLLRKKLLGLMTS
jgi:hypothetical protein